MRLHFYLVCSLALVAVLASGCRSAAHPPTPVSGSAASASAATPELFATLDELWLVEPYRTHDMAAYDTLVAEEFVIVHSNGGMLNKAQKRADILAAPLTPRDSSFRIATSSARVYGALAVSRGTLAELRSNVHYTHSYLRRDGRWQVVSSQLTRVPR